MLIPFLLFENSFAQQELTPHQQWKKFADPDILTCKPGFVLLQKYDGVPACVAPNTYLKLVDREFGFHNQSMLDKRPEMMHHLMQSMVSNDVLMHHWHQMMEKNPNLVIQTMDALTLQVKNNPELLKNLLGPMMSDTQLREKMIQTMKNHGQMENHLKMNPQWMISVHQSVSHSVMKNEPDAHLMKCPTCNVNLDENNQNYCSWCPTYQNSDNMSSTTISNSSKTMDLIHHVWVNSKMSYDMHMIMLEDPSHMYMMSKQMMGPMLNSVMDDEELRQEMTELMLEHQKFMNTIRHENPQSKH